MQDILSRRKSKTSFERGFDVKDFGTDSDKSVDYAVFAKIAGEAVASGECRLGIFCCGTGVGISMAANKVRSQSCKLRRYFLRAHDKTP